MSKIFNIASSWLGFRDSTMNIKLLQWEFITKQLVTLKLLIIRINGNFRG